VKKSGKKEEVDWILDLTSVFHKIDWKLFRGRWSGYWIIGFAILHQSTSETKISGDGPDRNSAFAHFYRYGNYWLHRKNASIICPVFLIDQDKVGVTNYQ